MYKRDPRLLVFISLLLVSSCAVLNQAEQETVSAKPEIEPSEAITKSRKLYAKRSDLGKVREAINILEKARNPEMRNFEVEWRFAKYSYYLGSRESVDDKASEKVLKRGLSAARIARRLEPKKADGYFWTGAIVGEQSKRNPVTVGIISTKKIRDAMQKVIEIDPRYEGASAYDVLGQLEMGTRGFAGGSAEKAVKFFEKALKLNMENVYIRLHLGEAYLAVKNAETARKHLQYVLSMKPHPDFVPEHEETVKKAKKLLAQKF